MVSSQLRNRSDFSSKSEKPLGGGKKPMQWQWLVVLTCVGDIMGWGLDFYKIVLYNCSYDLNAFFMKS